MYILYIYIIYIISYHIQISNGSSTSPVPSNARLHFQMQLQRAAATAGDDPAGCDEPSQGLHRDGHTAASNGAWTVSGGPLM